jgi:PAS domain S-box-containing protein
MLRRSQSVKAVVLLSLAMIAALIIGSAILLVDLHTRELAHAKSEMASLSRILSEQTTRAFDGISLSIRAGQERLSDQVGQGLALDSEPVRLLLRARTSGLPQVKSIFVVDRDGMAVNSSRSDFASSFSVGHRDFFRHFIKATNDEIFISRPERAQIDGEWTYYLAARLVDASGDFRGVLVAAINIEYFESLYESIRLDFVSRILLLNRDGILMAGQRQDKSLLGQAIVQPGLLEQIKDQPTAELVMTSFDAQGGRWYVAYQMVNGYPLMVSPAVNENDALIPWRRVALPMVGGVLLVVAFILLATGLLILGLLRKEHLETALKESDAKLRSMVQSVRDAILTVDSSGNVILFNVAAEKMFGLRANDVLGCKIEDVLSKSQPRALAQGFMRYLNEGRQSSSGLALLGLISLAQGGREFPVELSLSSTTFRGEILVTAVFRDLSERQRAEHELIETNRQLQALSAAQQNVREEERLRISRELHDELGQSLTGIRMEVSWLGSRLLAEQPELEKKVGAIKKLIDGSIASVRRISSELRPLVLDDLGFSAAANWYVKQFSERTGASVNLRLPEQDPENGSTIATALFRILQESLTNIARHANAGSVDIQLSLSENHWLLSVSDDGTGFDDKAAKHEGIGLIGMRERVQILGGAFNLTTAPGVGTRLEVRLPAKLS